MVDLLLYVIALQCAICLRSKSTILPPHASEKSLGNQFATYFSEKIKNIRDSFQSNDNVTDDLVCPPQSPGSFSQFSPVSSETILKFIMKSPRKSCQLDPIPTFLLKDCIDILLPSITLLVNYSLAERSLS